MVSTRTRLYFTHSLTLARLAGAIIFAALAFQDVPVWLALVPYSIAAASDVVDGALARNWAQDTHLGKVLDLVSDKSMTIVSLLFAAACNVPLLPLALIGTREVIMLGARLVVVDGMPVLTTSRVFGGMMAGAVWGTTIGLFLTRGTPNMSIIVWIYWACAIVYAANLVIRIMSARHRIKMLLSS
jgi:phosphatidylglycerophosphate synthase